MVTTQGPKIRPMFAAGRVCDPSEVPCVNFSPPAQGMALAVQRIRVLRELPQGVRKGHGFLWAAGMCFPLWAGFKGKANICWCRIWFRRVGTLWGPLGYFPPLSPKGAGWGWFSAGSVACISSSWRLDRTMCDGWFPCDIPKEAENCDFCSDPYHATDRKTDTSAAVLSDSRFDSLWLVWGGQEGDMGASTSHVSKNLAAHQRISAHALPGLLKRYILPN